MEPAMAERSDLSRLFRSPEFDQSFPRDHMVDALDKTLRGLGIDVDCQPNVHLDTEERPKKSPRAFCAPTNIPGKIYLGHQPPRRPRRLPGPVPRGRAHAALRARAR